MLIKDKSTNILLSSIYIYIIVKSQLQYTFNFLLLSMYKKVYHHIKIRQCK